MDDKDEKLREIHREIASAVVISKDGKFLFGRKDPTKGGVYSGAWHIPGGGVEEGESIDDALIRELGQEVVGLDISKYERTPIPIKGGGTSPKTLSTGERVLCHMSFNRFEVRLDQTAAELEQTLQPGDDLIELRWIGEQELSNLEQIPGGEEFFRQAGYLK